MVRLKSVGGKSRRGHGAAFLGLFGLLVAGNVMLCSWPTVAQEKQKKADQQKESAGKAETSPGLGDRKSQLEAMRRVATGIKVTGKIDKDKDQLFEPLPEALFRPLDTERSEFDGTVWGYGKTGRPAALLTLTLQRLGGEKFIWLYEFNSLSSRPVEATIPGFSFKWTTQKSGLDLKNIPDAPAAGENEAGRTRQIRDLSSRFTGYEKFSEGPNGPLKRFPLRLLPRPIHRYSDPDYGVVDGAIFLMTHNTNPEIVMVVELAGNSEKPAWKVGFARCAYAEIHVELDDKEFWSLPHIQGTSALEPYSMISRPADASEFEKR